jgi:hypothetical protein
MLSLACWVQASEVSSEQLPVKRSVLEFRIAPLAPEFDADGWYKLNRPSVLVDRLSKTKRDALVATLETAGPGSLSEDDSYAWFPLAASAGRLLDVVVADYQGMTYALLYTRPDKVMLAGDGDEDWSVADARLDVDERGVPAVTFTLDGAGKNRFAQITSQNVRRHMAILVDGEVYNAPMIMSAITAGRGQITTPSRREAEGIVVALGGEGPRQGLFDLDGVSWVTVSMVVVGLGVCAAILILIFKLAGKPKGV